MKRQILGIGLVLALGVATPALAGARTYFGFTIGLGNAPPPPRVVYYAPPPMDYDPDYGVYVVRGGYDGCDEFRYGPYFYVWNGDYWYRSRSYRGPFFAVDVRTVPRPVFYVPEERWHRYPPGLARYRGEWDHDRGRGHAWGRDRGDDDRGRGHGRGRGRGDDGGDDRGHGHGHDRDRGR